MTDERSAERAEELDDEGLRSASPMVLRTLVRFHRKERDALRKQLDEALAALEQMRIKRNAAERGERKAFTVNAQMTAALAGIRQYGSDTLSGRVDGPDNREWQRSAVQEMTRRANAALSQEPPASPSPVLRDAVIEDVLAEFAERTEAVPVGSANISIGASVYGWRIRHLRELREIAAALATTGDRT